MIPIIMAMAPKAIAVQFNPFSGVATTPTTPKIIAIKPSGIFQTKNPIKAKAIASHPITFPI